MTDMTRKSMSVNAQLCDIKRVVVVGVSWSSNHARHRLRGAVIAHVHRLSLGTMPTTTTLYLPGARGGSTGRDLVTSHTQRVGSPLVLPGTSAVPTPW